MIGRDRTDWVRIRRYAVPARMISECATARERGDWRAACAAGDVGVLFEPAGLVTRFGAEAAGRIAEMLAGFAPDLVRWHLPRVLSGHTALAPGITYVLAADGPVEPETVVLTLRSPASMLGAQRLTLGAARMHDLDHEVVRLAPCHWDARRAGELRAVVGGSAQRVPMFKPDGAPLPLARFGTGQDTPALAEEVWLACGGTRAEPGWLAPGAGDALAEEVRPGRAAGHARVRAADDALIEGERLERAVEDTWSMAGIVSGGTFEEPRFGRDGLDRALRVARTIDPLRLAAEARRVSAQFGQSSWALWYSWCYAVRIDVDGGTVRATPAESFYAEEPVPIRGLPILHRGLLGFPVDLDLVWSGMLRPDALHPDVQQALFGKTAEAAVAPLRVSETAVRVRCRGEWHPVEHRAGRLRLAAHPPAELQRERALAAFGGAVSGCFATSQAWDGQTGRLPKRLRAERDELWQRMLHGGARTVLDLLDDGLDPNLRDSRGRTLLHVAWSFDEPGLVARLLAAGADVNARDREGHTPLATAVAHEWPLELVKELVAGGAEVNCPSFNFEDMTVVEYFDFRIECGFAERGPQEKAVIDYLRGRG